MLLLHWDYKEKRNLGFIFLLKQLLVNKEADQTGTPKHHGILVSSYVYELYNEDIKEGSVSEKNRGLFNVNGKLIYTLQLMNSGMNYANNTENPSRCVAMEGVDRKMLQPTLD